jgi:hypothetical protein
MLVSPLEGKVLILCAKSQHAIIHLLSLSSFKDLIVSAVSRSALNQPLGLSCCPDSYRDCFSIHLSLRQVDSNHIAPYHPFIPYSSRIHSVPYRYGLFTGGIRNKPPFASPKYCPYRGKRSCGGWPFYQALAPAGAWRFPDFRSHYRWQWRKERRP